MRSVFFFNLAILCFLVISSLSLISTSINVKFLSPRNRAMLRRMGIAREDRKPRICYDFVGCFPDPAPHLSLKRRPEHPNVIQTRFLLYTREKRDTPQSLEYGDDFRSIIVSKFDPTKPLKIAIHGYKGSGNHKGSILLAHALLDLDDANILLLDWTKGAGTTYSAAVANTELVGRQLALILLDMMSLGTDPKDIHIIGFSLGAHIAGCASEMLKKKNILLGRITGLDPASPFFRHHLLREKSRKLDVTDAHLVDVIHTDGSEDFADGFGLLKPLGHIDFFPNGGRQQPGCLDVKNSVVVSHLKEDALDINIACSHLRAWWLFLETVKSQKSDCKFEAWPCNHGGGSYQKGLCFPSETSEWSQEMGYAANRGPLGIYYLTTRAEAPFCGQPLRASIRTLEGAPKALGTVYLKLLQGNSTTLFKIRCTLLRKNNEWMNFYNVAAAEYESVPRNLSKIDAVIWYEPSIEKVDEDSEEKANDSNVLFLNRVTVEDRKGTKWEYCSVNMKVNYQQTLLELRNERCTFV